MVTRPTLFPIQDGRWRPGERLAPLLLCWLAGVCVTLAVPGEQGGKPDDRAAIVSSAKPEAERSLYVEVSLAKPVKLSALRTGDAIEGHLARDVYAGDRKLFPSGSAIRLTVGNLERRRRESNDHWPGVVRLFLPRHENYPTFQSASVLPQGGPEVPLQVSLISISSRFVDIRPPVKKKRPAQSAKANPPPAESGAVASRSGLKGPESADLAKSKGNRSQTIVLEAAWPQQLSLAEQSEKSSSPPPVAPSALGTGTEAQVVLLSSLSASKSRPGDPFRARLVEPIRSASGGVLPAGSLFEGKVEKSKKPRWLSRAGSLYLTFTGLTLPAGNRVPVVAHVASAEVDQRSHMRLGAEGELTGAHPGKAWMLINLGVTGGVAKATDDTFQVIAEALVTSATDASTAGAARIVAACASTVYMVTRHGRDVVLPRFTRMEIAFDRPVSSSGTQR